MRSLLLAGVVLILGTGCLLSGERKDGQREIETVTASRVVVKVDHDCDPEIWRKATKFVEQGDVESVNWAIDFLADYLDHWDSQCKAVIKKLLQAVGEHRPDGGVEILSRFLRQAPERIWAETLAVAAADSLAAYGSIATDALIESTGSPSDRIAAAGALGLGRLSNARALFALKRLLGHASPKVQRSALIGLSRSCPPEVLESAIAALSSDSTGVRGGAMFYLSSCGDEREVSVFVSALGDQHEEVRVEALRGLTVLRNAGACWKVGELRRDDSSIVRELTEEYFREMCGSEKRGIDSPN